MLAKKTPPCPFAHERIARRDELEQTLKIKYDVDMRYDSRLCLNYINNLGKVLTIEEIAKELKLMDYLYHETSYSSMMGSLLTNHWQNCEPEHAVERYKLSDTFSAYCKELLATGAEKNLNLCSPTHCCFKNGTAHALQTIVDYD